jgi:BlaI family penicillinase repressor
MTRVATLLPAEFDHLGSRQCDLMRAIYETGGATAREVHARIPDPPSSICGVRTLLNRLARRGLLRTRRSGRHSEMLYLPAVVNPEVQLRAFDRIVREYFRGSKARAVDALERLAANETSRRNHDPIRRVA